LFVNGAVHFSEEQVTSSRIYPKRSRPLCGVIVNSPLAAIAGCKLVAKGADGFTSQTDI
jgi:hypothetical protein